jgi:hypothetical protein
MKSLTNLLKKFSLYATLLKPFAIAGYKRLNMLV